MATRWYRSPEQLLRYSYYDYKVDIFGLGCIAVELYTGMPMASGTTEHDQLLRLTRLLGPIPESWREGQAFAQKIGVE